MARTKQGKVVNDKGIPSPKIRQRNIRNSEEAINKMLLKEKRKHRFRPGTVSLREIKKYQNSTRLLIRRLPFQRLVREIVTNSEQEFRFSSAALFALQEATEAFMINIYEDAALCSHHAKRVTLLVRDIILTLRIKGVNY